MQRISRSFYDRDTTLVAQELPGKWVVHRTAAGERIGKIVEVEADPGAHDLASHSANGLTARTKTMFGLPGHAYVYLIYGVHHCLNVVTEHVGMGAAVLIRALEPVKPISGRTQGPGLLCRAMDIDRRLNGHDLPSDELLSLRRQPREKISIGKRPRIGVDYARQRAKRRPCFYLRDNPFGSRP